MARESLFATEAVNLSIQARLRMSSQCRLEDLSVSPSVHIKSWDWYQEPVIPALGRQMEASPGGLLAGPLSLISQYKARKRPCLKKKTKTKNKIKPKTMWLM